MIKLVRNSNTNRVIGIWINNKRYSLSKEICAALSREEDSNKKKAQQAKEESMLISKEIHNKYFTGNGSSISLEVLFKENGTVDCDNTRITFKHEHDEDSKDFYLMLLDDFLKALNQAHKLKTDEINNRIKKYTDSFLDDAA